jgi:segregation and condensation protein B
LGIDKYSALIETILFCENDVVMLNRIAKITGLTKEKIKEIVNQLNEEYQKDQHGLEIVELADGYSFQIKKEIYPFIKEYYNIKPQNKLSKSILTTLSIIAYKQPITKNEIEDIRGVSSDNAVKRLLELNYIEITGRKDVLGKPLLYGTTKEFLKHFNLKSITDLPKIDELKTDEFSLED